MQIPKGELAALATAICWTVSSLSFAAAGRRIGSLALNLIRLLLAFVFVTAFCSIRRGVPLPTDATPEAWAWLSLSGVIGFIVGDICLFRAFVLIGPRLSMLVMSLVPPIAALIGWILLGESLKPLDWLAMAVTLGGVVWVVLERGPSVGEQDALKVHPARGVLLAVGGAAGQAAGLVLSKVGMRDYDAFASTQIRILAGMAGFILLFFALRWWPHVFAGLRHRSGMAYAAMGALVGPFLGVSLSLVAIQHTQTGVAATIMAMVPVFIIPFVMVIDKEKVTGRAALGALIAVAGVAILWLQ